MTDFIREHIGVIGPWGNVILISLLALCLLGVWFAGRDNRLFVPAHLAGRLLSLALVTCVALLGVTLFLFDGRLSPFVSTSYKLYQAQGEQAPEIPFRLIADDSPHKLSDFRGKVVVLNFWATWCSPCIGEMGTLNRLHTTHQRDGVVVITLSDESRNSLVEFSKTHSLDTVSGYVPSFDWLKMATFRPHTLIIDRNGILREHVFGTQDYEFFERTVHRYL